MRLREDEQTDLTLLREEVHRLEQRVEALEHGPGTALTSTEPVFSERPGTGSGFEFSGATAVAGRAILALAGAYLLRALAESEVAPRLAVIALALIYGAGWLLLAGLGRGIGSVAAGAYGITCAFIVAPLLWEGAVRFGVLTPVLTAAILTGFAGLTFALSRRAGTEASFRSVVLPAIVLTNSLTALVLAVRTGDLVPFTAALLGIAWMTEADWAPVRGWFLRVAATLLADISVCLVIFIAGRGTATPEGYRTLAPWVCVSLFGAFFAGQLAGVARTLMLRRDLPLLDMMQFAICLMVSAGGILQVTKGGAIPLLGACCAVLSALCYFTLFGYVRENARKSRYFLNFWAVTFGLLACFLVLPDSLLTPIWSMAAVIAVLTGTRTAATELRVHGDLYLAAAALIAGGPATAAVIAVASLSCYVFYLRDSEAARPELTVVPAAIGAFSLWTLVTSVPAPLSLTAAFRTLVLCAIALVLAYSGARRSRGELVWISYAAIALGTVKLMLEDFRQSKPAALAFSLVCYGAMLILTPRLSRVRVKA